MNSKKNRFYNNICFWLFVIATLLLIGVLLFGVYLYNIHLIKFIDFRALLFDENNFFNPDLFWAALESIGTVVGTIAAIFIGILTINISERLQGIEEKQHQLYTEPHTFVDTIIIQPARFEMTRETNILKGLKEFNYPYYNDKSEELDFSNSSILVLGFINASEAFARLRFDSAVFKKGNIVVANFDMSTIGTHINHQMITSGNDKNDARIGLIISNKKMVELESTTLTISCFLDNNFGECFKETQSYHIANIVENVISFYPADFKNNVYKKIH